MPCNAFGTQWEKLENQIKLRIKELCAYSSKDESIIRKLNLCPIWCQFKVKVNRYIPQCMWAWKQAYKHCDILRKKEFVWPVATFWLCSWFDYCGRMKEKIQFKKFLKDLKEMDKKNGNQQMQKKSHNLVSKEAQSYKSIASASACQCDSSQSISLVIKEK